MPKNNIYKADLGYLGEKYQNLLVKYFIEFPDFFTNIVPIVDQNMFTDEHLRRIVGMMKNSYEKKGATLNYNDLELQIRTSISDNITIEIMLEKVKLLKSSEFGIDVDILKTNAEKFFKQQNLAKAINQCTEILKRGNADSYYQMEDLIKKALDVNLDTKLGWHLFENLEDDLKEDFRFTIPTGVDKLDESLYGGLGKGELGLIISPLGVGKAQPLSSRVLTPTGYRTMGDIEVGDYVIGGDGQKHKVLETFPQGMRPVYKIEFTNGTTCECDINHLWNVNTYFQRKRKTYNKEEGTKQHNPDWSFKTLGLKEIINKGLRRKDKNGVEKQYMFHIPTVKPINFDKQEISIDPYFLGYFIGNGNLKKNSFFIKKDDYTELYHEIIHSANSLFKENFDKYHDAWVLNLEGNLYNDMRDLIGFRKHIPNEYLYNTTEVRVNLLKGLMDSHGYINKKGNVLYSTKSKQLANDITFIVRSLGGEVILKEKLSSFYTKKQDKNISKVIEYTLHISFESEIIPFNLKRKAERFKPSTKYLNNNCFKSIEYKGEEETKCILIDSDEHTYVTEDFIVTHNTSITTGFAAHAATYKCEKNNYKGYKVLHFYFEDENVSIRRKYYGNITEIEACELSNPINKPVAMQKLSDEHNEKRKLLQNNIIGQRLSSGEYSASDIKYLIKQYISRGFIPDMVIIDYFECLNPEKSNGSFNDSEWSNEGRTMRKLESMANEFNIALWVPVQSTKGAIGQEYVGLGDAGGSVKKTQIGHVIIQIAQTVEQKEEGRLNIYIGKLRAARLGRTSFPNVKFNNGTCKFDMSDLDSIDTEPLGFDNNNNRNNSQNNYINMAKNAIRSY